MLLLTYGLYPTYKRQRSTLDCTSMNSVSIYTVCFFLRNNIILTVQIQIIQHGWSESTQLMLWVSITDALKVYHITMYKDEIQEISFCSTEVDP